MPSAPVTRPVELETEAAAVWTELAPHATAEGTLTPRTVTAFAWLCRSVVIERKLGLSSETVGRGDHRGMMQRVESGFHRFRLIPDGKPVRVVEAKDAFEEFDAQPLKVVGGTG